MKAGKRKKEFPGGQEVCRRCHKDFALDGEACASCGWDGDLESLGEQAHSAWILEEEKANGSKVYALHLNGKKTDQRVTIPG